MISRILVSVLACAAAALAGSWESIPVKNANVRVFDQTGRERQFYSGLVEGKVVVVNFMFTGCTQVCPMLTSTFGALQQELLRRGMGDVTLISVSVDPENDTPEVLQRYAARMKVKSGWTFVTGNKLDLDRILTIFGVSAPRDKHTQQFVIGNEAQGRWTRISGLAAVSDLVQVVEEARGR